MIILICREKKYTIYFQLFVIKINLYMIFSFLDIFRYLFEYLIKDPLFSILWIILFFFCNMNNKNKILGFKV